jgi:hypothetical protein
MKNTQQPVDGCTRKREAIIRDGVGGRTLIGDRTSGRRSLRVTTTVAAQSGRRVTFADLLARRTASTRTPRPEGRGVDQLSD